MAPSSARGISQGVLEARRHLACVDSWPDEKSGRVGATCPRSSADRAPASGAGCAGSSPAEGALPRALCDGALPRAPLRPLTALQWH